MNKNRERGFSLIELLIVVAIIAIISSIAIVQYNKLKISAYKNTTLNDFKNSLTMIIGFKSTYGDYPNSGSCGPGPTQCELTDGNNTVNPGIVVSRDVTIEWTLNGNCSDGSERLELTGTHEQVNNWEISYNTCDNRIVK